MKFGQLHHVEYYVHDLPRAMELWDWFLSRMGYTQYQKWEQGISWKHESGTYIVFVQVAPSARQLKNNRHANGLNHIAFQGKDSAHFEELVTGLRERNVKMLTLRDDYLCFEDMNDFAVEVYL